VIIQQPSCLSCPVCPVFASKSSRDCRQTCRGPRLDSRRPPNSPRSIILAIVRSEQQSRLAASLIRTHFSAIRDSIIAPSQVCFQTLVLNAAARFNLLTTLATSAYPPSTTSNQFVCLRTRFWRLQYRVQMLVWSQSIVSAHWLYCANCVTLAAKSNVRRTHGSSISHNFSAQYASQHI
jgi:hypothetical protein